MCQTLRADNSLHVKYFPTVSVVLSSRGTTFSFLIKLSASGTLETEIAFYEFLGQLGNPELHDGLFILSLKYSMYLS